MWLEDSFVIFDADASQVPVFPSSHQEKAENHCFLTSVLQPQILSTH